MDLSPLEGLFVVTLDTIENVHDITKTVYNIYRE